MGLGSAHRLCCSTVVKNLEHDGAATTLEFQETSNRIEFKREGSDVKLEANYADGRVSVPFADLRRAVESATRELRENLLSRYPQISANPTFHDMFSGKESSGEGP